MRYVRDLAIVIAVILAIGFVYHSVKDMRAQAELTKIREGQAVSECLNNGGLARFDYYAGADHFTLVGCTFSRQVERP